MTKVKNTNNRFKTVLIRTFAVIGILSLALVAHIVIKVADKSPSAFHQLARVDFDTETSIEEIQLLQEDLKSEEGYVSTYLNKDDKIMIYKFDSRYNNGNQIYENRIKNKIPNSERYVVTEKMKTQGCPVTSDSSIYGRLTAMITRIMY